LADVQFTLSVRDGATTAVPPNVTHISVLIALADEVLDNILNRIQESNNVEMLAIMVYRHQVHMLEEMEDWIVRDHYPIRLETSGEQHQVYIVQRVWPV
jgi:hypothetical protein